MIRTILEGVRVSILWVVIAILAMVWSIYLVIIMAFVGLVYLILGPDATRRTRRAGRSF